MIWCLRALWGGSLTRLRCWFLLRSFSSFLPSRWSRRLRWLFLSRRPRRFQLIKARLDFVSQLRRISLPGLCEPLDCACMTPQCCSVQWNGFVIIGPKERGRREQSVCLNNQRKEEGEFFVLCKDSCPIRMDFEVRIFPYERPDNSDGVGILTNPMPYGSKYLLVKCLGHGRQRWTCGLLGREHQHRRLLCLRSTARQGNPIVLFGSCWRYPRIRHRTLSQVHRWGWRKWAMVPHRCTGNILPAWNHTLLDSDQLWLCHSLQGSGYHLHLACSIACLRKCLANVHRRHLCYLRDTAFWCWQCSSCRYPAVEARVKDVATICLSGKAAKPWVPHVGV